jgi:tetratricopeptide (TPR) repeat protein
MHDNDNAISIQVNEHELIMQARKLIAAEREEEAFNVIRQVLKVNPNNLMALLLYGQLSPNSEQAIKALKKVLSIDPRNRDARLQLRILQGIK